jgi:hypothetical protein
LDPTPKVFGAMLAPKPVSTYEADTGWTPIPATFLRVTVSL